MHSSSLAVATVTHHASGARRPQGLDVTQVMAGPFCSDACSPTSAPTSIKVEPPAATRRGRCPAASAPTARASTPSTAASASIVLDLKTPRGVEVVLRLARDGRHRHRELPAGRDAALGLDYETLAADNPGLIYASISGYGQTGPDAREGRIRSGRAGRGRDHVGHRRARRAAGEVRRAADRSRRRALRVVGDPGGARITGTGPAAGSRSTLRWSTPASRCRCGKRPNTSPARGVPSAPGSAHRMNAPYQAIRCADGFITLGGANDRLFAQLCDVLGHRHGWPTRRSRPTPPRPAPRRSSPRPSKPITIGEPRAHWLALFDANEIPCGPINDYAQVFADPQVHRARDGRGDRAPDARPAADARLADQDERDAAGRGRRAPQLGEHTTEVLRETGYSDADIQALRTEQVVR